MVLDEPIKNEIPCECGAKNCNLGLIIGKYPEDKIKFQIIDNEDIKTIVIDKKKLLNALKFREQYDENYKQIMSLIPKDRTILDLGCGNGGPFIGEKFPFLMGVDIWKKKFEMPEYDVIYFYDIKKILEIVYPKFFDIVTCIDVIEHLEKEEGLKLIEDAEKMAWDKVIFFTPKKWDETKNKDSFENPKWWSFGNEYCLHKSHWTEKDFTDRGYEIIPNKDYILAKKELNDGKIKV